VVEQQHCSLKMVGICCKVFVSLLVIAGFARSQGQVLVVNETQVSTPERFALLVHLLFSLNIL